MQVSERVGRAHRAGLLGSGEPVNPASQRSGVGCRARSVRPRGVGVAAAVEGNGPRQVLASNLVFSSSQARVVLLFLLLLLLRCESEGSDEERHCPHRGASICPPLRRNHQQHFGSKCFPLTGTAWPLRPSAPGLLACPPPAPPPWAGLL